MMGQDTVRILALEDDPALALLLRRSLERNGFSVDAVVNGREGLDRLAGESYDVVIADYLMPVMGGIEMIRALAEQGRNIPVIMVTGEGNEEVAAQALKLGAADYIVKDVQMKYLDLLPAVIEKVLSRQQLVREREQIFDALRESEDRYRRLFESNPLPMWVHDLYTFAFLAVNEAAVRHYGYSRDEFLSMTIMDIRPPEDSSQRQDHTTQALDRAGVWRHRKKDGTIINVEIVSHTLDFGERRAEMVMANDVTERLKSEEERIRSQKLESLGVLAGGIAHDFNNLLTAILGNITLAGFDIRSDGELAKRLEEAERATIRARDLTQQLLTFSKGGEPVKRTVEIADLINEAAGFALRGSRSRCEFSAAPDLRAVEADEGQISQVINNLLINADQAMPEGGVVTVRCENHTVAPGSGLPVAPGEYVKITITDQGIGIPQDHLIKIFDPYFTTKQKGSGLGLATAYSILKRHGGYLTVESELGRGAAFMVYVPAVEHRAEPALRAPNGVVRGTGKILVMDDEAMIREVSHKMLTSMGYTVEVSSDGVEAVEKYFAARASGTPFDVVIMDLTIPGGMGGKDAIQKLRAIDPAVKAIVSSGYSNDPIMAEFENYGFCGVVAKPYSIKTLSEIVKSVRDSKIE